MGEEDLKKEALLQQTPSIAWPIAPNTLERNFQTDAPNKIWLTDISQYRIFNPILEDTD